MPSTARRGSGGHILRCSGTFNHVPSELAVVSPGTAEGCKIRRGVHAAVEPPGFHARSGRAYGVAFIQERPPGLCRRSGEVLHSCS